MIPNGFITVPSRRVLLIENSPSDRQMLRHWLNGEMIEAYEAVDIITALAACQNYQPDLILLQLRLHTWDGFEVIKRLKEDPRTRSIPVIFLSASALTAEKAKGIVMGAVDFVSKPYDSVELLARVNSALRTKALLNLLEQRAHLDGLTELGNRFALQDTLPMEIAACRKKGCALSILITDLDHFKRVNDVHGHAAGDEVLRRIAMVLRASVREGDFLARYGGEEFVVLSPNCNAATALETAERIRVGVSDHRVSFRNSSIQMTSSFGIATVEPPYPDEPQEILERADQALYRAKSAGRNAVWLWDPVRKSPVAAADFGAVMADSMPAPAEASSTVAGPH
jgi:diguanylate cyclase (GGDEF)-like protein